MARAICRNLKFACLTCETEQTKMCWMYDDAYDQEKNTPFPDKCANPDCTDPHIMYVPKRSSLAQVRAEQRTVVYVYPDGTYGVPDNNDPRGELAKTLAEAGGVRREFNSIREMREFQRSQGFAAREKWIREIDSGMYEESGYEVGTPDFKRLQDAMYDSARNQVIDYDERSLRENRDRLREQFEEKRQKHQESMERFKRLKVGRRGDSERYERLRRGGR